VEFLDAFVETNTKKTVLEGLTKDKQVKDKRFKAVAYRILRGVAIRVAGEAGGELTNIFGDAVKGIIDGSVDEVTKAAGEINFEDNSLTYS